MQPKYFILYNIYLQLICPLTTNISSLLEPHFIPDPLYPHSTPTIWNLTASTTTCNATAKRDQIPTRNNCPTLSCHPNLSISSTILPHSSHQYFQTLPPLSVAPIPPPLFYPLMKPLHSTLPNYPLLPSFILPPPQPRLNPSAFSNNPNALSNNPFTCPSPPSTCLFHTSQTKLA